MASNDKTKPNILLIMSDDHGAWAMGCAGNDEIQTPNLDKLAQHGMRFDNFFCASPVCSPARASIFTGKIPSQHGVHDWIASGHVSHSELSQDLKNHLYKKDVPWEYQWPNNQLQFHEDAIRYLEGQKTFTEVLASKGYKCGISGKWHLGDSVKPQAGFTYWKTTAFGGDNYFYPVVIEDGEVILKKNKYVTEYITENALDYINQCSSDDQPFYLSVHYTAPHAPWGKEHHPQDFYKLYENCPFNSVPFEKAHPWGGQPKDENEAKKFRETSLKGYFTAVTAMDYGIGQIIDELKRNDILDNTLIIFTSDNGMSMGHHGIFGKGNGTFPQNMYDTAVKVPMIISKSNEINNGETSHAMLSHYDIMPTLLDYLGLKDEVDCSLPGHSFAPLLQGEQFNQSEDIVIMDEYGPVRMIRTKEWKYVHRYPYGPNELYDMVNDPNEKNNLIDDKTKQDIIADLRYRLKKWFIKYVNPEIDGSKEDVYGSGQINFVGLKNCGKKAFIGNKSPKYE